MDNTINLNELPRTEKIPENELLLYANQDDNSGKAIEFGKIKKQLEDELPGFSEDIPEIQNKIAILEEQARTAADLLYKGKVASATSKAEVDTLFAEWWKYQYDPELYTKSDMLERWFGTVLEDTRVHGVTTPRYSKSTSMIGELTDDSAGLMYTVYRINRRSRSICTPSTVLVSGGIGGKERRWIPCNLLCGAY